MEIRKKIDLKKLREECLTTDNPEFRKKSELRGNICSVSLFFTDQGPLPHFCRYQGQSYIPEKKDYGFFTCEYRCSQKK